MTWLVISGRLDFSPLLSAPFNGIHLMGMGLLFMSMSVQGLRWWLLLRTQKLYLTPLKTVSLVWIGQFFSLVLPGVAGGELARGYYITREASDDKIAGLSTVLLDRVMGLYALLWLGIVSVLYIVVFEERLLSPVLQLGILNVLLFGGASLLFLALWIQSTRKVTLRLVPRRYRKLVESTLNDYRMSSRTILLCFILSLLASILVLMPFQLAGQIAQVSLTWKQIFLVCPLVFMASTLPLSPGGIGVGEAAASLLFSRFGVETGAAIMLIFRVWLIILRLPGGLLYLAYTPDPSIEMPLKE